MYVLGLTGGIASGKTTASQILNEYGAKIIDADQVAYQLQAKGQIGLKKIIQTFGREYLNCDGELNRRKLGNLVFNDQKELAKLNQIMHPLIKERILQLIKADQFQKLVVIDMALLFEGGYEKLCTSTLVIDTTPQRQLQQLMQRNHLSKKEALARIDLQMSQTKRDQLADEIIKNTGSVEDLKRKMIKWLASKNLL